MNLLHESGTAPSLFWASFFSPIIWRGGGQGVGRLFCEDPAKPSMLYPDPLYPKGAISGPVPLCHLPAVSSNRLLHLPEFQFPYLQSDVITSTFHSDARMSTCTSSHFLLTPERGEEKGKQRQPQGRSWKANEQMVKDLAEFS